MIKLQEPAVATHLKLNFKCCIPVKQVFRASIHVAFKGGVKGKRSVSHILQLYSYVLSLICTLFRSVFVVTMAPWALKV